MAAPIMENPPDLLGKWSELKSQSDSPLVKWCVLAIGIIVLWVWIIEPLQVWTSDLQDQVDRNARKASRLLTLEKNADRWLTAAEEARSVLAEAERSLFVSSSNTQSQASIQGILRDYAQSRNLSLESQKLLPSEPMPPIGVRLPIEVGLRGELIDVLYFMDDVSRSGKLFVIDQWIIQIERNQKAFVRFRAAGIRPAEVEDPRDV